MRARFINMDNDEFSKSYKLVLKHNADEKLLISTKKSRLIPNSISCVKYTNASWVSGNKTFIIYIKDDSIILNIDVNNNFYNFGNEEDTPINRGKQIYDYAVKNNVDIIKINNVPQVGTEYDILNVNCVKSYHLKK